MKFILLLLFSSVILMAEKYGRGLSISAGVVYSNTSRMYYYPNSLDEYLRDEYVLIEDISGYSIDLRYNILDDLFFLFSGEWLEATENDKFTYVYNPSGGLVPVRITDGYNFIPLEFSSLFQLPFSTYNLFFYIGGGIGIYFVQHIREVSSVSVGNSEQKFSYGIHSLIGIEFLFLDNFSIKGKMKFRDPEVEMISEYDSEEFEFRGETYQLPSKEFDSKINLNGIIFSLSLSFYLKKSLI